MDYDHEAENELLASGVEGDSDELDAYAEYDKHESDYDSLRPRRLRRDAAPMNKLQVRLGNVLCNGFLVIFLYFTAKSWKKFAISTRCKALRFNGTVRGTLGQFVGHFEIGIS